MSSVVWVPAVINGFFTAVAIGVGRRSLRAGFGAVLAILVLYVAASWFWPGFRPQPGESELFWMYLIVGSLTWIPGAVLAIAAGRRWPRMAWLGVIAVGLSVITGAGLSSTALAVACGLFGHCL
jgi:hypothetical protein